MFYHLIYILIQRINGEQLSVDNVCTEKFHCTREGNMSSLGGKEVELIGLHSRKPRKTNWRREIPYEQNNMYKSMEGGTYSTCLSKNETKDREKC